VVAARPRALTFPIIAILCGVGLAYIAQTAHETAARYEVAKLHGEQIALIQQNAQLNDQFARAGAASQIEIAAQKLGMQPATRWTYVAAAAAPIYLLQTPVQTAGNHSNDPLQDLVAMLDGSFGPSNAQAATP
jgi:hypothetical protein